jgi:type II secretory pathway pseudopilin PulG
MSESSYRRAVEQAAAAQAASAESATSEARLNANRANGRGRDASYPTPPAQIRTCRIPAYGSYLG